jgi:OOP family OmpA-OmpF porin
MKFCCLALSFFVLSAVAVTNIGHVRSNSQYPVKNFENQCVHTAYYNPMRDGIAECNEPTTKIVIESIVVSDDDVVLFDFEKHVLTASGAAVLNDILNKIDSQRSILELSVIGYTDQLGESEYNMSLSQQRALAVKEFFVSRGVSPDIITTEGLGMQNAKVSDQCFTRFGYDPMKHILDIEHLLKSPKFASRRMTHKNRRELIMLQHNLHRYEAMRADLINCTARDRRVELVVKYKKSLSKTVPINQ